MTNPKKTPLESLQRSEGQSVRGGQRQVSTVSSERQPERIPASEPRRLKGIYRHNEACCLPVWALRALRDDKTQVTRIHAAIHACHDASRFLTSTQLTDRQRRQWLDNVQEWASADVLEGWMPPPVIGRASCNRTLKRYEPELSPVNGTGYNTHQEASYRHTFAAVVKGIIKGGDKKKERALCEISRVRDGLQDFYGSVWWAPPWDQMTEPPSREKVSRELASLMDGLQETVIQQINFAVRENQDAPEIYAEEEPPGILADLVRWINDSAMYLQPDLALANAICAMGTIFGRKVRDRFQTRTNIYFVGIGGSGCGKDHSRQCIKTLFDETGASEHLGGEDLASAPGLLESLQRCPSRLFQIDEAGLFFENVKSKQATSHQKEIPSIFMRLYSSAGGTYLGKEYATQERPEIVQPCCCMYGTTTPGTFFEALKGGEVSSGFLPRLSLVRARDDFPDARQPTADNARPPESVAEFVKAWVGWEPPKPGDTGDIRAAIGCFPKIIQTEPEALRMWQEGNKAMREKAREAPDKVAALYTRCGELANKLALISACSRHRPEEVFCIDNDDMGWAWLTTELLTKWAVDVVMQRVADNPKQKLRNELLEVIKEHGPISKGQLLRRKQKCSAKDLDDPIRTLEDMGLIRIIPTQARRGPGTVAYVATDEA